MVSETSTWHDSWFFGKLGRLWVRPSQTLSWECPSFGLLCSQLSNLLRNWQDPQGSLPLRVRIGKDQILRLLRSHSVLKPCLVNRGKCIPRIGHDWPNPVWLVQRLITANGCFERKILATNRACWWWFQPRCSWALKPKSSFVEAVLPLEKNYSVHVAC